MEGWLEGRVGVIITLRTEMRNSASVSVLSGLGLAPPAYREGVHHLKRGHTTVRGIVGACAARLVEQQLVCDRREVGLAPAEVGGTPL